MKASVWRVLPNAKLPVRMTGGSVGYDVCAAKDYTFYLDDFYIVTTGLIIKPPPKHHVEVMLRSSLPKKKGLIIPHGLGLIDYDFCGEHDVIGVPLLKAKEGTEDDLEDEFGWKTTVSAGERIAQVVFRKTVLVDIDDNTDNPFSKRTRGGFGSTGKGIK